VGICEGTGDPAIRLRQGLRHVDARPPEFVLTDNPGMVLMRQILTAL
jgi:hypothetical protein